MTSIPGGREALFDILYFVGAFVLVPKYAARMLAGRRAREGWGQRFGRSPRFDPQKERIWIHAVSVGEAQAAKGIVRAAKEELAGVDIVVSTTTETGQEVAAKAFGEEKCFYAPFDLSGAVSRSIRRISPSVIVLMELEIWPNLILAAARRRIPVVVVNGRITERSYQSYVRVRKLLLPAFRLVTAWGVQTDAYAERLAVLGVPESRMIITGNMKYDAAILEPDEAETERARAALQLAAGEIPVVAGSTHPGEEEIFLTACKKLRAEYPDLTPIVVPRHVERSNDIESCARRLGFSVVSRSRTKLGEKRPPGSVIVVDTVGELSGIYRVVAAAFVGGSLVPHGGQNMIEPAALGKVPLFGPHTENFREPARALLDNDSAILVDSTDTLYSAFKRLLSQPEEREAMGRRARETVSFHKGATRRNLTIIKNALESRRRHQQRR